MDGDLGDGDGDGSDECARLSRGKQVYVCACRRLYISMIYICAVVSSISEAWRAVVNFKLNFMQQDVVMMMERRASRKIELPSSKNMYLSTKVSSIRAVQITYPTTGHRHRRNWKLETATTVSRVLTRTPGDSR